MSPMIDLVYEMKSWQWVTVKDVIYMRISNEEYEEKFRISILQV